MIAPHPEQPRLAHPLDSWTRLARFNQEVTMVPLIALWLPIVLSAVFVFLASWLIHMLLPYHRTDFSKVPGEAEVQDALRKFNIPPGDYMLPHAGGPEGMKSADYNDKRKKGPVIVMTVMKPGPMSMGSDLLQWFIYCLVVSVIAAYVAGHALAAGAHYLQVFRFAGCTAFACYAMAQWQNSIWYKQKWSTTFKNNIDGLIYGMLTAGTLGCFWPK
jgi:hypothetical protein